MKAELEALKSIEFHVSLGCYSTYESFQRTIGRNEYVKSLTRAIEAGTVAEEDIRAFVEDCLLEFEVGVQFEHDAALGAIAVSLGEFDITSFSDEYLTDLAYLQNISEIHMAPRVAALVLREMEEEK